MIAISVLVAGAGGCLGLTLRMGQRNPSRMLVAMFAIWVLSPFVALVFADVAARRWTATMRMILYAVMVIVAAGSLAVYGDVAFGPPRAKPAFAFLVTPLVAWAVIVAVAVAGYLGGRRD